MNVRESTVEEVLRSEDLESLIEAGAPDNEYWPEVRGIMDALALLGNSDITEDCLTAIIRDVWAQLFGPFRDYELEMRMLAFRQVAHRILIQDSQ